MPKFKSLHRLWLAVVVLGLSQALHASPLRAEISSRFLVRGETATLEYVLDEMSDPGALLKVPAVDGLSIRRLELRAVPRRGQNGSIEYAFSFSVNSYQPGEYTIPPAVFISQQGELTSDPVKLQILNETELKWSTVQIPGKREPLSYSAAFYTTGKEPYVNQVQPAELKVYFPEDERIEDRGIPEFERDGIAAWRFEPRRKFGRANLLGSSFRVLTYPSSLSPTRAGPIKLGPATLRLMTRQISVQNFGSQTFQPANLVIPPLELSAKALPPGAPEGFEDAVGQFNLNVTCPETEVREGDPINVNIIISGRGNLDTLNVPKPLDSEGWKLYPPSPLQQNSRRSISGFAAYRQFMRPLRAQSSVPPFRLVYFDPAMEEYQTLISPAIPLQVLPSTSAPMVGAAAPPALSVPIEQMTDILGILDTKGKLLTTGRNLPTWAWQIIPALLALLLLASILKSRLMPLLAKDPDDVARRRDLRDLDRAPKDLRGFYRSAGHFVERWLGTSNDPIAAEVLEKRDATCFRPEAATEEIPRSERLKILKSLRRLALPLILFAFVFAPSSLRAEEPSGAPESPPAAMISGTDPGSIAYDEGMFSEAARLWLDSGPIDQLSADTLYNLGNASYRLGAPGEAALYWRRALARDSTHAEARQNLRFFERKFGSIAIKRPDYQYALGKISLASWKNFVWIALWLIVLGLLVFPATSQVSRLRIAAVAALVTAPLLLLAGICGWYYYPDDARFAPVEEQVVIVSDQGSVRTDAARNSPIVIEAPAGSLCRILTRSGDWAYIAFTNETRGWIPATELEFVIPHDQPEVPKRRIPDSETKSA